MFEQGSRNGEIIVAGAGPAGLALATELSRCGLRTTVVDPALSLAWKNSFGGFERDARGLDLETALKSRFEAPLVWASQTERTALRETYLRFSSEALKRLLMERASRAGVRFVEGIVGESDIPKHSGLVVDATGRGLLTRRRNQAPGFFQSAYGLWIDATNSPFRHGEMTLMDFRGPLEKSLPSFLYAMPEGQRKKGEALFVQETVLVSEKPVCFELLRNRLLARLSRMSIGIHSELGEERCLIPMGGALPQGDETVLSFGASAGLVHPATGYQLLRALRLARPVAQAVARGMQTSPRAAISLGTSAMWSPHDRQAWRLYRFGAAVIAAFNQPSMREFVQAFFELSPAQWLGFMTGRLEPQEALGVMWQLFLRAPVSLRFQLLKASSVQSAHALGAAFAAS